MPLSPPSQDTFAVGQKLTAAAMNKNVRDAVLFLANPPLFVGVQATAQAIANNTNTPITLDVTTVDSYGGHSNTINNSRYVAQIAGWYLVTGKVNFGSSTAAGGRSVMIAVNGAGSAPSQVNSPIPAGFTSTGTTYPVYLNAGDYVEVWANQTTGASITTTAGYSSMSVLWEHI